MSLLKKTIPSSICQLLRYAVLTQRVATLAAIMCLAGQKVVLADNIWDGGGGAPGNWNTAANWGSDTLPTFSGTLTFTGTTQTGTNNDLALDTLIGGITFDNSTTGGVFTLAGNRITLGGNITTVGTTGTPTHLLNLDMILNGTRTISAITSNNITVNGTIGETGGSFGLIKSGAGTLTLSNAANSFTGAFSVNQGTVSISSIAASGTNSALGAGSVINIGSGSTTGGTLTYTGTTTSTITVNRDINLAATSTGGGTINNNGSGALVFNGAFTTGQNASGTKFLTLGGSNTGANDFQSIIINGSAGATGVSKSNNGTWTLSGANTFTGLLAVNQGTLNLATIADTGSSNAGLGTQIRIGSTSSTATLNYTGSGNTTVRQIQIGNNSTTPVVGDTGGATLNNNGTGALVFTNAAFNLTNLTGSLATSRTLTLGGTNTDANTIQGVIADGLSGTLATALTKANGGLWILSGSNTYTGATTVSAGTLQVNNSTNGLGNSATAISLNGGTLSLRNNGAGNNGAVTFGSTLSPAGYNVQLAATSTINVANLTANTGNIIDLGTLTQATAAARTLNVTGGNGYTLRLASLQLNPGTGQTTTLNPTTASLVITGNVINPMSGFTSSNYDTLVLDGTSTGNIIGGVIADATGGSIAAGGTTRLTKSNTSTWTLQSSNTYTGITTINGGTLKMAANNAISTVSALTVAGLSINATLDLDSFNQTMGSTITLGSNSTTVANLTNTIQGTGTLNLGGTTTYNAGAVGFNNGTATISANLATNGATRSFTVSDSANAALELLVSGNISGSNTLVKNGLGVMRWTGNNSSFTGSIQLNNGTLEFDNPNALGSGGNTLRIGETATTGTLIYLGSTDATIARPVQVGINAASSNGIIRNNGTGTLTFSAASNGIVSATTTNMLTLGGTNTGANTFQSIIKDNTGGFVAVTKEDTGKWILSGNNTYTGATSVNGGTLVINGTNTSAITVASGAQLDGEGSTSGALVFAGSTHTINADVSTAGALGSTGGGSTSVASLADGQFIVNLTGTYTAPAKILTYGSGGFSGSLAKFAVGTHAGITLSGRGASFTNNGTDAILFDTGFAARTWAGSNGTNPTFWDNGTTTNWQEGDQKYFDGDSVTFDDSATASGPVTVALQTNVAPGSAVTFSNATKAYVLNDAGGGQGITGNTVLIKSGAADLTINNANTYTGGTTLSAGTLTISNVGALGSGLVLMEDSPSNSTPTLRFTNPTGQIFTNAITQSNQGNNKWLVFDIAGQGTITLSGAIVFDDSQGGFRHIINANDDNVTFSGVVSGAAGFDKRGSGTLTLNNDANTFGAASGSGNYFTVRDGGTVEVTSIANAGVASAAGAVAEFRLGNSNTDGNLAFIGTTNQTTDRQIRVGGVNDSSGTGGAGVLNNSATGTLTFTNGTFNLANTNGPNNQSRDLTLAGTNTGSNEILGAIVDNATAAGGIVRLVKAGTGKWILSGTSTFTGGTLVNDGTLVLGHATDTLLDTGAVNVNGGTLDMATNADTVGAVTLTSGTITGSTAVLSGSSFDLQSGTVSAILGGSGALTKTTTGTVTLSSVSTYSGATSINAGILDLTGSITNSAITINNGGTLNLTGSATGGITVGNGGILKGEGTANTFATVAGGILSINGTTGGAFTTTGNFDSSNGVSVLVETAPVSGVFTVANYGAWTGALGNFSINAGGIQASARGAAFASTGSAITLDLGTVANTWIGTTDGIWGKGDGKANWSNATDTVFQDNDFVTFDETGIARNNITLAAGVTFAPANITFSNTSAAYTIDDVTTDVETLTTTGVSGITLSGANTAAVALNIKITGTTNINHSGTGTLTLGGGGVTNDFTGGIVVNGGGTLVTASDTALGNNANTLTISNGSTLDLNGDRNLKSYSPNNIVISGAGVGGNGAIINSGSQAQNAFDQVFFAGDVTLGGTNGRYDFDGSISTSLDANLTVTKVGTNDIIFNANNTGASIANWVINGGGLTGVNDNAFGNGAITVNSGGFLVGSTNGGTRTLTNHINLAGGSIRVAFRDDVVLDLSGIITVSADSRLDPNNDTRTINLTGTLTQSGSGGTLTIGNGKVIIASSLNATGYTGSFLINDTNSVFELGNGVTLAQNTVVTDNNGNKTLQLADSGGNSGIGTVSGGITIDETTAGNFDVSVFATDTLTLSGVISSGGAAGIEKVGAGKVILSNNNTYTGPTTLTAGTLQIGNGSTTGTLGANSDVSVATGTTLNFNRTNTYTYGGIISGAGAVNVNTGTLNLTGTSTHTGTLTVAAGANLDGEGSTNGAIVFSGSTHTINADLGTAGALGALGTTGSVDVSALTDGMFFVNVTGNGVGPVNILTYGTTFTGSVAKFAVGTGTVSARGATFADNGLGGTNLGAITFDAGFASRTWNGGTGTWDVGTSTNWLEGDNKFFNGDSVIFAGSVSAGTVTLAGDVTVGGMTIQNSGNAFTFTGSTITSTGDIILNNDVDVIINSILAGTGALIKQEKNGVNGTSNGTLFLTNANTYTGGTFIEEGEIDVTHSAAFGTGTVTLSDNGSDTPAIILSAADLHIANNIVVTDAGFRKDIRFDIVGSGNASTISGAIDIQETSDWATQIYVGFGETLTLSGVISGDGTPRARSSGALVLGNANNSFTGPARVDQSATLEVASIKNSGVNSHAGAGSYLIIGADTTSPAVLSYTGSGDSTDRQVQLGATGGNNLNQNGGGTLANNGTGALIFTNPQFTRQETNTREQIAARTLTLGGTNTDNNEIQGVIMDNAGDNSTDDLIVNGIDDTVNTVNIEKVDAGKWILSGNNTYTGTTTVSGGSLVIGSTGKTGTGAVTVQTGGTILGSGVIQGSSFTAASGSTVHAGDTTAEGSYGTLNFTPASGSGSFDFQSGSTTILGLNPGGTSDLLSFDGLSAGTLTFDGNLTVLATGFTPVAAATFNLLDWANITTLSFNSRYSAGSYSGYLLGNGDDNLGFDLPDISSTTFGWDISQFTTNGTISLVDLVPEPSRALFLFIGLCSLISRRRRGAC